jgi:hypothetical protein
MSMLTQALQLMPYVAIASGVLLGTAIGVICYRQRDRHAASGGSWRVSIVSAFGTLRSLLRRAWPPRPGVIVHDPSSSKPHDLDDPFFDRKVQEAVGATIARAARKK